MTLRDPDEVGIDGPDVPPLVLLHEQAYRPVEPHLWARRQELRAERWVAEYEDGRRKHLDPGLCGELALVDLLEEPDAFGRDVRFETGDRLVERKCALHLDDAVAADRLRRCGERCGESGSDDGGGQEPQDADMHRNLLPRLRFGGKPFGSALPRRADLHDG